jgi:FAD/FMN-containing dehydrogenase
MNSEKFCSGSKKSCPAKLFLNRRPEKLFRRQMVRRASARRRRPAPLDKSVSAILRFANQNKIPVTARGGGHGYVGGCVPIRGGIVLSLERMNRILEINAKDFVAVVQPAVITEQFQNAVEKLNLFYPPDPASRANNFIGGNIATNAGGPRCLKYGVTRDYVLGLEVVLADGTIVRSAAARTKTKPASICTGSLSARKVCSASSPRRR